MVVKGNVVIGEDCRYGFCMEGGSIRIGGNLVYHPVNHSRLSGGTLEDCGNLDLGNRFSACGSHRTILCGQKAQTVWADESTEFGILEIENATGKTIYSSQSLKCNTLIQNGCPIVCQTITGEYGYKLEGNKIYEGDLVLLGDTLDLNGYELKVMGDLIVADGQVKINGGSLLVAGDLRMQVRMKENGSYVFPPFIRCFIACKYHVVWTFFTVSPVNYIKKHARILFVKHTSACFRR